MFFNGIPRVSVDLDLVYLPIDERSTACQNIEAALKRIINELKRAGYHVCFLVLID
jgi:hypothetical protein